MHHDLYCDPNDGIFYSGYGNDKNKFLYGLERDSQRESAKNNGFNIRWSLSLRTIGCIGHKEQVNHNQIRGTY